ncbi:M28 family metallopeptidase [Lentzea sp. NPDC059081]|uniref:M28 family metallopeptidase n=1 Tax=Lentzea sp. NPDC059081 TaxID=3346719 RepID=UPI0036989F1E
MTGSEQVVAEDDLLALADAIDATRMLSDLESLCAPEFAGRGVGSAGHDLATDWLTEKLTDFGLRPEKQVFDIAATFRLTAAPVFSVAGPDPATLEHRVDYAEHPRSGPMPTPAEGVARSLGSAPRAGEWVVLDKVPQGEAFTELAAQVRAAGGIGLLTPQNPDGSGFLTKRVMGGKPVDVPVIAVRADLLAQIDGKVVRAQVQLGRGPVAGTNVVAGIAGTDPDLADRPVLISAHYDGVGADPERHFQCAGDNGSGVAVLLEIVRVITERGLALPRPFLFAVLDAEEIGALGSRHHAGALVDAGIRPDVINVDMAGKFNGAVAAEVGKDTEALISALDRAGRALRIPLAGGAVASDNRSYAGRDLPAVGLGLGAAHYHSPLDSLDRIDPEALRMAGRLVVLSAAYLAQNI